MLDQATTLHQEIFTAIMLRTVTQFDVLQSSENTGSIFKGMMALVQWHIYITMHVQALTAEMWRIKKSCSWDTLIDQTEWLKI